MLDIQRDQKATVSLYVFLSNPGYHFYFFSLRGHPIHFHCSLVFSNIKYSEVTSYA